MVLELFRELLSVGGLRGDHLPLPGLLQHGSIPVISPHGSHQDAVLEGKSGESERLTLHCVKIAQPVTLYIKVLVSLS